MKYLVCACCGTAFMGWQHHDRDTGFGICKDKFCTQSYGYCTEGKRKDNDARHKDPDHSDIQQ
jgi:hypothetical protein